MDALLGAWSRSPYKPEFLTIWLSPYGLIEDGKYRKRRFSRDEDYMITKLRTARRKMEKHGFAQTPLCVSRWNLSLSCRSMMNKLRVGIVGCGGIANQNTTTISSTSRHRLLINSF